RHCIEDALAGFLRNLDAGRTIEDDRHGRLRAARELGDVCHGDPLRRSRALGMRGTARGRPLWVGLVHSHVRPRDGAAPEAILSIPRPGKSTCQARRYMTRLRTIRWTSAAAPSRT